MRGTTLKCAASALLLGAAAARAQQPAAPATTAAAEAGTKETLHQQTDRETAAQPGQYAYQPGSRRDPFISLLVNIGPSLAGVRPPGIKGLMIQEVAIKGVVKDQTGYIAMLLGPGDKNYFVRIGQRLYDGVVTAIEAGTVTFREELTDPLSPVKTRDVKKSLYSSEEARQ